MIFFSWVSSRVITPARPTSEPVPAVVGTAMIGATPSVLARVHRSPMSSKSQTGRDCATMKATHLPTSSAEPPPTATTPSWPPALKASIPARRFDSVGLACTSEKMLIGIPASQMRWAMPATRSVSASPLSVTSNGLAIPCVLHASGSSAMRPTPVMTRVGKFQAPVISTAMSCSRCSMRRRKDCSGVSASKPRRGGPASDDLEIARELPVGDRLAKLAFFPVPRHRVVIDERIAEQVTGGGGGRQPVGGLRQCPRQGSRGRVRDVVGAAHDGLPGLDPVLDSPKARTQRRGDGEVWIDVGGGYPVLHALARWRARNDAQRAGPIFDSPGGGGRRPEPRDQTRIAVHRGGDHRQHLRKQGLLAADEPTHGVRHVAWTSDVVTDRPATVTPPPH